MARTSPPPSDEAQPLNTRPSRIVVDDTELHNQSFDGPTPPSSPGASTSYYSGTSQGRGEATRSHPTPDGQDQRQHEMHHPSPEPPNQSDKCIQTLWLWESLSIAVATLALTAIVITLVLRSDRPLPDWPSEITLNALIAVFTAIFKACLMVPITEGIGQLKWLWYQKPRPLRHMEQWDLASRGPWGSLLLIPVLSCRNLAVIGAILTILAMAVDPFTQQVVQHYSCSRVIKGERATIPFSNNYTAGSWFPHEIYGDTFSQLDTQMQSAMYVGLIDPPANISAALEFECRTGNCKFPATDNGATFMSLALESRCTDISNDVSSSSETEIFNQSSTSGFKRARIQIKDESTSVNFITYKTTTNATLSDYGAKLNNVFSVIKVNYQGNSYPYQNMTLSDDVLRSGSRTPTDKPSQFLSKVAFLMFPTPSKGQPEPQDIHAFECEFYPAVNTFSANITNGVLLEQVLDSQRMDVWPEGTAINALLIVDRTIREGKWHECNSSLSSSEVNNVPVVYDPTPWVPAGFTPRELEGLNITWWPQDCVYHLPTDAAGSLSEAISGLLGNETLSYSGIIELITKGNPWSATLWNNGTPALDTFQATMDGMTRLVTATLRQGDGLSVNMGPANGTVLGTQTCVRVEWVWLALPAGLLVVTIVFLLLTIIKTRSRQARVWKSSIFAVLFSGLDQHTRQADGPVVSLEGMKAAAGRATVRLEDTKEGLRLVSQGDWRPAKPA